MTNTENISLYFKDIATRHPLIRHSDAKQKFFDVEWDELMQKGAVILPEWSLVLEDYSVKLRDNNGDWVSKLQSVAFFIGRSIKTGNYALKLETWIKAEEIAMHVFGKMRSDEREKCYADVPPGVKGPHEVDLNKSDIMRVRMPFFDHAFGVRAVVGLRFEDGSVELDRNMVPWDELD